MENHIITDIISACSVVIKEAKPYPFIRKRSGALQEFESSKIIIAVSRALWETKESDPVAACTVVEGVIELLEKKHAEDADTMPSIEYVQDLVERVLMQKGYLETAKSYILYRQLRAEERKKEQQELLEKVEKEELFVVKRSGKRVRFEFDEIHNFLLGCVVELDRVVISDILESLKMTIYDGISTAQINQLLVMITKSFIERDEQYSRLAARILMNDVYREVLTVDEFAEDFSVRYAQGFSQCINNGIAANRYDVLLKDQFDIDLLAKELDRSRDHLFEYMGFQVLFDRYFMRDMQQAIIEVPQYFWMRIAMGLSIDEDNPTARAIEFYHILSSLLYVPSTPTLLHSGTVHAQMSSCYLNYVNDDLHHIFKVIGDNAQMLKWSGGLGTDWTAVRATNAHVKSINLFSQGVVPFIKINDATIASINRSGRRRGAAAVYLETWHMDIEEFLDLRKNTGDDRRRAHDTSTVNWIPDLFMKRLAEGRDWTLFSPDDTPDLHDLYGQAFQQRYEYYEKQAANGVITLTKTLPARDLWRKMITMLFETGHPWMTFKDACNIRSPQDHVGVVHNSNLCTEITLNTSETETAVCNLGSLNLIRFVRNGEIDWDAMRQVVDSAMRMLDNVIDRNYYPTPESKTSNIRHRPVGLGIMGLQDVFFAKKLAFDSVEAMDLSDAIMEFVSHSAIGASSRLAQERGQYESYTGSKWDRGLMPQDTIALLETERGLATHITMSSWMDWGPVRASVAQHGMRNSNVLAIAPTATIANISGSLPSIEPIYKNLYTKSNFSGEFTVVNQMLVDELRELGLWDTDMLHKIKQADGSIQKISEIPANLRQIYREAFEIDAHVLIDHAVRRGKWIDQSQSLNLFVRGASGSYLSELYQSAWRKGIKTTYYLRTLGATAIEKSTIGLETAPNPVDVTAVSPKVSIEMFTEGTCESCQ